jgi:hypothetical protein
VVLGWLVGLLYWLLDLSGVRDLANSLADWIASGMPDWYVEAGEPEKAAWGLVMLGMAAMASALGLALRFLRAAARRGFVLIQT